MFSRLVPSAHVCALGALAAVSLFTASASQASVVASSLVQSVISVTGVSSGDDQYRIRGGASVADQILFEDGTGTGFLDLEATVDGAPVGDAAALGFAGGAVSGQVFDMGIGDAVTLAGIAEATASAPFGLADALVLLDGALEIANLSLSESLQVEFFWSVFIDLVAVADGPGPEDGIATGDITLNTATLLGDGVTLSSPVSVVSPFSLTADALLGPTTDAFFEEFAFSLFLEPGQTQVLLLTADAGATAAAAASDPAMVPGPAAGWLLLTALVLGRLPTAPGRRGAA